MPSARLIGRVFDDNVRDEPRTHVFIIGVGQYGYGRGPEATDIASGLDQLTSPPKSAAAIANYFINEFANEDHPLGTVTMLVSGGLSAADRVVFGIPARLPRATLRNVKKAMEQWKSAFQDHVGNMLVFYFCGHGVSLGQKAAMLLEDFGNDDNGYEPAIELDTLRGTLMKAMPSKQLFLVDCCRTAADHAYKHEASLGTRVLSITRDDRPRGQLPRQSVLVPTLDGQVAFGELEEVSVFTSCFLDAVRFAGVSNDSGKWSSTVAQIHDAVGKLVDHRLRRDMREKSVPTGKDVTNFEFNHVDAPTVARSIVAIDDVVTSPVTITATETAGAGHLPKTMIKQSHEPYRCCTFQLEFGRWRFDGTPGITPPYLHPEEREIFPQRPVVYVELKGRP
ncbi:caspase family protein [Rhizobium leguminosarum]|uniref:caspase family protein n=1 Tax=Rhizobium leguminosarum TaxID=384 RepID=UPI00103221C0|nr:caspase family protein [Rhizobium leguminosarum]TAX38978.1 caspase family protein [Rhizobium leguminosarum]